MRASLASSTAVDLRWSCSDNVGYGAAFARSFTGDNARRRTDTDSAATVSSGPAVDVRQRAMERQLVNMHNANVGRKV